MRKIILLLLGILICILLYIFIDYNISIDISVTNNIVEINTTHRISEFVDKILNASLVDGDNEIFFDKLGINKVPIRVKNNFGKTYKQEIDVEVVDNTSPIIECNDIESYVHDEIDLFKFAKIEDNSKEEIIPVIIGKYDINKVGTYNLKYSAADSSGNKSECSFNLTIKNKIVKADIESNQYYIKLNKTQNVVMIYSLDSSNNYNTLIKTFTISAGNNTPLGIFKIKDRHEYISFSGGTYGRFGVRIDGPYWFHSVPYNSLPKDGHWDNVSYNEYNKLGSLASAGCIRLAVKDAKWIYENIPKGTTIEIYESDSLPEGIIKPPTKKIDIESEYRGWDPTDEDRSNPWNK